MKKIEKYNVDYLVSLSNKVRKNSLEAIFHAKSGHPGGVLSCIDILVYLFKIELKYTFHNDNVKMFDRFILSKGHAVPALYATAAELGFIGIEKLKELRKLGSHLQGHPVHRSFPWVEASTGSLAQGFSFAIGEALGFRHQKIDNRIYVLLGDGELQEGEIWEGAMSASKFKLSNLCAIIDYNKLQSDDYNKNIMNLEPLVDKWKSFNWNVIEINGHDFEEMEGGFNNARKSKDKPSIIIAHTIKGKGISFMEGSPNWHGSVKLSDEDYQTILKELETDN